MADPVPESSPRLLDIALIDAALDLLEPELVDFRRDLHAHPELAWSETRTSTLIRERLDQAGVRLLPLDGTGVLAEIGPADAPVVALRADIDALPVPDRTEDPWRSVVDSVAHACGHDVHTTALLGAALALQKAEENDLKGAGPVLRHRVRFVFQPAEEVMPGGARHLLPLGVLDDVERIFTLHCDPTLDVGTVGLREGPVTGAADALEVRLTGGGGHTSRPHLTQDLTFALGKLITELPAALSRRLDPRAGASVVWGMVSAGAAMNVIPSSGRAAGTVRMLDAQAWSHAEQVISELVAQLMAPYGVSAEIGYVRGVPPVVNDAAAIEALRSLAGDLLGPESVQPTHQSLGGEDFAWYTERVPGALLRLGTRTPGGPTYDLHQGDLRIDERAIGIGARILARAGALSPP